VRLVGDLYLGSAFYLQLFERCFFLANAIVSKVAVTMANAIKVSAALLNSGVEVGLAGAEVVVNVGAVLLSVCQFATVQVKFSWEPT